jgi:transporter family protein
MWIALAICSALCLGIYDIFKKVSVKNNNVLTVLMLNTLFGSLLLSPIIISQVADGSFGFGGDASCHLLILVKSLIVLSSWILGYFSIKHLPITINGPISATRPIIVLLGATIIFGEQLNWLQYTGIFLGFCSLFFISQIGKKEGFSLSNNRWLWLCLGSTLMGAVSALYDKYLIRNLSPLDVQAWYSLYQFLIMSTVILIIRRFNKEKQTRFQWRWSIPCIALFLTIADIAYFYALSLDGALIAVVSMIRRGSVIVSFVYGVTALREQNIRLKMADLSLLLVGLTLLILGSK